MKKNKIVWVLGFIVLSLGIGCFLGISLTKNVYEQEREEKTVKKVKHSNTLSMMLETGAGTGEYQKTTRSTWPTDGYVFNTELSKCENGSKLSWDDENNKVIMTGSTSDKCYVYFDLVIQALSNYVKSQYTGIQGANGIYLHNSSLANGAGDNSYRYAGANPNNYVCFGSNATTCPNDNLYRIIGVFGDKVKLIKYDYATSTQLGTNGEYAATSFEKNSYSSYKGSLSSVPRYFWHYRTVEDGNSTNAWSANLLNIINLNNNFANNIGNTWSNMIDESAWIVGKNLEDNIKNAAMSEVYAKEIVSPPAGDTFNAKIGLMYVSDYGYAASPTYWTYKGYDTETTDYRAAKNDNWLYMGLNEWTITTMDSTTYRTFTISSDGKVYYDGLFRNNFVIHGSDAVRPTFYLKSSINYVSGLGTKESPIRIATPSVSTTLAAACSSTTKLANGIKKYRNENSAESTNIYIHNSSLANGAKDDSYRYAGANPDNYVCFGSFESPCPSDNLYRIIGVFGEKIKIVKADFVTSSQLGANQDYYGGYYDGNTDYYKGNMNTSNIAAYYWNNVNSSATYSATGSYNMWNYSYLNIENLNTTYLNSLGTTWSNFIDSHSWVIGGNASQNIYSATNMYTAYQKEIVSPVTTATHSAKIGLMYATDYGYAAIPSNWQKPLNNYHKAVGSNWLYMGMEEWLLTRTSSDNSNAFMIKRGGNVNTDSVYESAYAVRPTIYLSSNVAYNGGSGTKNDPLYLRLIMI